MIEIASRRPKVITAANRGGVGSSAVKTAGPAAARMSSTRDDRAERPERRVGLVGPPLRLGRPPGVRVVLVVGGDAGAGGEPRLADQHHQPARELDQSL